jgi:ABC-type nickel/cobalt efflux system permease component RcnA
VADRRRTYLESLFFAGIFTVTHLLDIVLLFAVTRGIFAIADPTAYMSSLQIGATALLAGVGLWLVVGAIRRIRVPAAEEAPVSVRVGFLTGMIAGIAPCTFGWSLFLLLFSLGRLDLVPLILLAFGTGIFACLALVATALCFVRERTYRGLDLFARWSPLASGLLVLGIAGWLASAYLA